MNIEILSLVDGAKKAKGITVIIDVFRAFTLEAYAFEAGVKEIYAVSDEKQARTMKEKNPSYLLIGEREGKKLSGFDYGNSPAALSGVNLTNQVIVHTTSNGTQGIANAINAEEILTGSLVNAKATADYILSKHPKDVSLVAMGWKEHRTEEDELCAQYIKSLLLGKPMNDIQAKADELRYYEGKKFFDPNQQDAFPQADFAMCVIPDIFSFVIKVKKQDTYAICRKKDIYE